MKKLEKKRKTNSHLLDIVVNHINNNLKIYSAISIIFLIGIIIGVMFINNTEEEQKTEIITYLQNFTNSLNSEYKIDNANLLKNSIINNLVLVLLLWFIGSTVVGIPIVYIIIGIRGFLLGYTVSSIMITYSFWKGILFSLSSLLLQNIIFIPCIFALAASGVKLYKSIIKDKRKENIKLEILRHTVFSIVIAVFLVTASLIEVYVSSNLIELTAGIYM